METKSLCGMFASWDGDTRSERQWSCVMWSCVYIVNKGWRSRGVHQALMESLFHNKIKFVKSWARGKGKLPYRQVLPRLKYVVQSHAVPRLTVWLTSSLHVTGRVAIHELERTWKESVVAGVESSHHLPGGTEEKYGKPQDISVWRNMKHKCYWHMTSDATHYHGVVGNWTEGLFCLSL